MGNALSNRSPSSSDVTNRSNRINRARAIQGGDNQQSVAVDKRRSDAYRGLAKKTRYVRRFFTKSRADRASNYLKFSSFIGENGKWLSSVPPPACHNATQNVQASDCSPCFNRRNSASYLLDTLNGAADECTSVCCDLITVLTATCNDNHQWKLSDSFSGLFCGPLNCIPASDESPAASQLLRSRSAVSLLSLPCHSTAAVRHDSSPSRDCSKDVNGGRDGDSVVMSGAKASSVCELFSTVGEHASLSAGTEVFNHGSVSASSAERRQAQLGIHEYVELDPLISQAPFGDCNTHRTAACCQQLHETMLPHSGSPCAADNSETLSVHEFATWYKETVMIMQQQSSDNTPFSRFLSNNLQLFSKADLRKLKTLNADAQTQVRDSVVQTGKLRAALCYSLNHAYAKFASERERELRQLTVQQKEEQRQLVSGHKATTKKTEKQLRSEVRRGKRGEELGGLTSVQEELDGSAVDIWECRSSHSLRRSASRWLPWACYGYVGSVPDGALETLIVAQLGEMKLEKERKLHELQCKFAVEKRQLLMEQEERRFANLQCAIRQLSQFEVTEARAFCQRRCELLTKRVKTEIDLIRRVRQAKRDALCRRQKSELKRVRKARRKRHDDAILALCDVTCPPGTADSRAQHQADLREFDQTTAKLSDSFESMASQKLRDLMDLCELRFNQLRSIVQCKIAALREQHAERLRLLQAQLDNQNSLQTRFPARQTCLPLDHNALKAYRCSTMRERVESF